MLTRAVWLPQVLALALEVATSTAQQPAEMRHRASSAWRECASKIARNPRGGNTGSRALLLFALGALLPRGVAASEAQICVKAITLGGYHTCANMVRKSPKPSRFLIVHNGGRPISGFNLIPASRSTLVYCIWQHAGTKLSPEKGRPP